MRLGFRICISRFSHDAAHFIFALNIFSFVK